MSEIDLKRFFLEQVPLFASFPADKVEEIVIKSRLATFEGNEAMLETGDETRHFGIMISGHAEISNADNTGTRTVIAQLGPGDVFGVLSLLTGDRIAADVIAGNRCFVLMVPQEVFASHILVNPKAVAYLSRLLAERTRAISVGELAADGQAKAGAGDLLSLTTRQPGKVVALNVGISQIHFGIYDTEESGADIHGIIDNADQQHAQITIMVGPQRQTLEHEPFKLSDL
ncbi:MAG TPA: Crp/Fnr family transcriptional regulator, partial [Azonexus sp.]|nr:Crp/Fnr family transcriptional regulator [Azonexus sp.]